MTSSLDQLMSAGVPLNRKERFYTGTVLPMIVCREDFRYLGRFCQLIPGCPPAQITGDPRAQVQFFTEYNLADSLLGSVKTRFPNAPAGRQAPDVLILFDSSPRLLVVIEAKMFDFTTPLTLKTQLQAQQPMVAYLATTLKATPCHCALVPESLGNTLSSGTPYFTWESVRDTFQQIAPDDYFLAVLRYALDHHAELLGSSAVFGKNAEARVAGQQLYDDYLAEQSPYLHMGRSGGLNGTRLQRDLTTGSWRTQTYEVTSIDEPPNRNWFSIVDFVGRIINLQGGIK